MRHFRMLLLLDHHRQTSKAAAVLNVTQPAVSKSLADLESGLGVKLFERNARGLSPTPMGECLIRCARMVLGQLADTGEELDALSRDEMKPIRVGSLPATATSLIPACLAKMKEIAPSTSIFVREATMDSLLSEIRSGGIEMIVGVLSDLQSYGDLDQEVLFIDPTIFVVRRSHPLSDLVSLDLASLANYPWVIPPFQSLLGESLLEWFHNNGMARPSNIIETLSFSVIRHYLTLSDAIATVPGSAAVQPRWSDDFHTLPLTPPALVRPVGVSWHRERPRTPGALLFTKCLRMVVDESVRPVL